jgi:hypothetical protein
MILLKQCEIEGKNEKNIAIFYDLRFILVCDGNSLQVIGESNIAKDLRNIISDKNSGYNGIREEQGSNFDPVEYLACSSMTFIAEYHDYSEEKIIELKKLI